jgi:amino acid adenylation domain-containing protein
MNPHWAGGQAEMAMTDSRSISIAERKDFSRESVKTTSTLTTVERSKILFDWNNTAGDYPATECLHDALTRQAAIQPNAIALIDGSKQVTFRQLNEQANRLANYLRKQGIKPGALVGICLPRSVEMIVAVIAVSKAGGAYVPFDPGYPKDRLAFMLEDTAAPLVITQNDLLERLPAEKAKYLCYDQLANTLEGYPCSNPLPSATSDTLAYVIYTSGSTGTPKGVMVRHRAVVNTIDWVNQTFNVNPHDRLLFVTSLSFDLSVYDIFGILGAGGSMRLVRDQEIREPAKLASLLRSADITMWDSAPAALQQLTPFFAKIQTNTSLRLVMLSGDWIPVTLPDQVRQTFPNARVMSLGGATEASIWSNWYPIGTVDPSWSSIPYGKPIRNARYHILNDQMQPVPVGTPGELHIGGICLAEGYLNRPELTANRFVEDPFTIGGRLYKTGDLARYWSDGNIEFLGRIDHQVKVRGFRVELGEIESTLAQYPSVGTAVVQPFRDTTGSIYLVAFIIPKGTVTTSELNDYLHEHLPDYMIPASFVFVSSLPLTPNGKLDRAQLKAPERGTPHALSGEFVAPVNDAERALQEVWEEVLNVRPVSVTARFEDLGGQSLMAASLVYQIEARLGHKVPVEALFRAPTIRSLSDYIQDQLETGPEIVVSLNEQGNHPPLFLIAGAGGHVFAFHKFARLLGRDFPSYGMKAVGVDGQETPLDRIEEIAARYLEEIVRVRPQGPYILAGYSVGGLVAFELALQMRQRGLEVAQVIAFDSHAPGYPKRLPWPKRIAVHGRNFLALTGEAKWAYLLKRFRNLRHRILIRCGFGHWDLPTVPGVGGLSENVLRRVWASLERARDRYRPEGKFDGDFVLVRSNMPEVWAATEMDDPQMGWSSRLTQSARVIEVPVGHMEIFGDDNLDLLVREVRGVIRG